MEVLLLNSNNEWVDFSDKYIRMSSVTHKSGDITTKSSFTTSIGKIVMDNSDSYWEDPDNWSSSNWTLSKNENEVFFKGISLILRQKDKDGNITPIGRYKIKSFSTKQGLAYFELYSLSQWLKEKTAENTKYGHAWYQFRSISFLLEELLKQEFHEKSITGTVSSVSNPNITLDSNIPKWAIGANILRNGNELYTIVSKNNNTEIEVNYIQSTATTFSWSGGDTYKIDGSDTLPLSYFIPNRINIPTYGNIRVFSNVGKTPTNVQSNQYQRS